MRKWLTQVTTGLVIAVVSAVLTNLLTGQPLAGLTKLKGLSQTFLRSSVPSWMFALALFLALLGLYHFGAHFRRTLKGKVHFVPDAHNSGWAPQSDTQIEVRAGGTFTYEGTGGLTVLKAFLKGTQPVDDMMVLVYPTGSLGTVPVRNLDLPARCPVKAFISLRLTPVRGIRGKPLQGRLVFRDNKYIGPRVT